MDGPLWQQLFHVSRLPTKFFIHQLFSRWQASHRWLFTSWHRQQCTRGSTSCNSIWLARGRKLEKKMQILTQLTSSVPCFATVRSNEHTAVQIAQQWSVFLPVKISTNVFRCCYKAMCRPTRRSHIGSVELTLADGGPSSGEWLLRSGFRYGWIPFFRNEGN